MRTVVSVDSITQSYDGSIVIDELSFSLSKGMIGCLLGPSGCGKTTVLRCIAGFEPVASGAIHIDGRVVSSAGHRVPTEQRNVGVVFQEYALFPHLSVEANIAFGLLRWTRTDVGHRVAEMLELVGLAEVRKRYPHEISGGQQQRVALARALAPRPELLLLDEPFSNLDVDLRERLSSEVRDLLKSQNATALLVTHDQHEAFAMADEIGVMHAGRLQQWGEAAGVYQHPVNRFVADFVGQGVFLPASVDALGGLLTELGPCTASNAANLGSGCEVLLRPEDIVVDDNCALRARILARTFRGADILYTLETPAGSRLRCVASSREDHDVGTHLGIRLREGKFNVFWE